MVAVAMIVRIKVFTFMVITRARLKGWFWQKIPTFRFWRLCGPPDAARAKPTKREN